MTTDALQAEVLDNAKPETVQQTLLNLQKAATAVQKSSKDEEWAGITSYNEDEIPPLMMAKLYASLPWGAGGSYLTIPQALMLAIVARRRKLNPEEGDIFILPSGRIGTSLQGQLKDAKQRGNKLSAPIFVDVKRAWPKGVVLTHKERGRDIDFALDEEPGVLCQLKVNDEEVCYTAWLISWYMPANPNWYNRMDWMLRVRAHTRALALGTGIGVSEEIVDTDSSTTRTERTPVAPTAIPSGVKR